MFLAMCRGFLDLGFINVPPLSAQDIPITSYHLGNIKTYIHTYCLFRLFIERRSLPRAIDHPYPIVTVFPIIPKTRAHESQLPNRNPSTMSKQFTANDVKENGSVEKGLHIIIDNEVYEMGGFVDEHPGGAKILKRVGGKDASKQFWKVSWMRIFMTEIPVLWHHLLHFRSWPVKTSIVMSA